MVDHTGATDQDAVHRTLEDRARALAAVPPEDDRSDWVDCIVITCGGERFALDIRNVREAQPLDSLAPVPGTPEMWRGVINMRGTVFAVLDLARYLSLPDVGQAPSPAVVLVTAGSLTVGLLSDDVPEVRRIRMTEVGPPLAPPAAGRTHAIRGVTPDLLSMLDLEAILTDPRLVVEDEPEGLRGTR